ncbi:MAG: DUF1134 domain-containing protein [Pontixanthobacter sp.]
MAITAKMTPNLGGFAKAAMGALALIATPALAQIEQVDPNSAIDGDLDRSDRAQMEERPGDQSDYDGPAYVEERPYGNGVADPRPTEPAAERAAAPAAEPGFARQMDDPAPGTQAAPSWSDPAVAAVDPTRPTSDVPPADTYQEDDLIGAAQGLFGDGAKEVAGFIQRLLADQGEPNGYIVGREAGGAFILGARYGSGTLYHKVEGKRDVYWTGPSIGFDAGANAGNTFVLVYNLYDTEELFRRFPAGEGQAYAIGGMTASYLRWGDTVLIPIRVGAGLRLGINAGYMRFSKKQRWLPF